MSIGGDASTILPPALLARPSVRRGSVFSDLITIFRRSSSHPNRLFHYLSRSSTNKLATNENQETEKFLKPTACDHERNEEEESEKCDKAMSRQVLLDKIREKKEVIGKLRCQPWNMNRKRRTLRLAQKYVAQHESRVSKTHLLKVELRKRWGAFCRWADNIKIYLIPWEARIKRIESRFGSVVSSYFTFLRWIIYVNLIITLIIISFIVIPEMLADATADPSRVNRTTSRKIISSRELIHADELQVVSNFDGYFKYSPLFYGYYSNDEFIGTRVRYALPLAYLIITLFVFGYSCFAILRKMAMNASLSKMSDTKTDQYIFSWKLFGGWDYTIGNTETACNTAMAIVIKLRESIVECRINSEKKFKPLLFLARVLANAIILLMLAFSIYTITVAVQTSETVEKDGNLFTKNEVPTIIATITNVFPMIFDLIGQIERYHPRTALRTHLTRVLVLYVLNYITFIIALFEKLDKIRNDELMKIINEQNAMFLHGEQYPTTTKFHSRNFANIKQANTFAKASLERFSNFHQKSSKIHEDTREKRETLTRPSSKSAGGITIESRYGPVGLNNPSALLANKSYPWDQGRFRAIRIGPPSLPTFPIPALPPNPTSNTSVITELGPHRQLRPKGQHPKAVVLPTVATTNQASSQKLPKATRIPWSSKGTKSTKIRKITTSTPVVVVDSGNKLSNDKPFMFKKRAKIRPKIAPTKASISRKNFNMVRSNEVPTDATRAPVISDKPVNTLSNRKNAATSKWTLPNSNTKDSTLTVDVSGIREAKPMRATLLSNGSGRVIPASNNATTIYQIEKQVLTISDEAEMGNNFCWETMIGQEIAKLVTMDFIITIASIFIIDFFRDLWIKYCNSWWCWNMETTFPEYGEFKVAENVLHIINNQGMVWLGLFFAPLLPALNNLKLIILMYIRGWACMTCNVPAREIFRASRSSNFYLMVLLLWLLLCTLPVGYVIASKKPSSSCGPFAGYPRFYNVLTQMLEGRLDRKVMGWLRYLASPGVVIPVLLLLMLIIYFLVSLVRGLQKKNSDLQQQLIHERTEEKKKIFELAGTAQRKNSEKNREKKKQAITYLPLIEQKRREPWRSCNSQDYDSSLCVTDKSSTMTSPDSGQSFSPKNRSRRQLLPRKSIQQESTKILQPVPQQFIRKDSTEQSIGGNGEESNGLFSPPTTGRSNDWLKQDDSEDSELQPYSIESGVIEEATSEEVRLANSSLFTKPSLSQLAVPEPKTNKKAVSSPPQLNLPETHQLSSTSESHISTSQLLFPPTISNDESTINGAATNGTESNIPLIADTQTEKPKISTPLRKATSIEDRGEQEFAPWQSAKQTQSQISGFSKRQQESKNGFGNDQPSKSMSSCMKSENLEDSPPAFQQHHQRRFRISVSPTRRFQSQSGPSGSDTDTSTGKRRYVIRQEIFPDLTLSGSMNDSGISHRKSSVHSSHAAEIHNGKDN